MMEAFQFGSSVESILFGKGVLVDLQMDELEPLTANAEPDGLSIAFSHVSRTCRRLSGGGSCGKRTDLGKSAVLRLGGWAQ